MIKRFNLDRDESGEYMCQDNDGEYVRFEDHVAEVQRIILHRTLVSKAAPPEEKPTPPNEEQDPYKRGKLDGIDAAATYCEATLAGNHPSLAHAFRHAAINIRAFAGFKVEATTLDGMAALSPQNTIDLCTQCGGEHEGGICGLDGSDMNNGKQS